MKRFLTRRNLLSGAAIGAGGLLTGCDSLNKSPAFRSVLKSTENANRILHRSLGDRMALAREFTEADLSPSFRGNGNRGIETPEYKAMIESGFEGWMLEIEGLVENPQIFSLDQIRSMPQRTQITRHDCVEGWSAIGKWKGVPLKLLLDAAKPKNGAKYLIFHCADKFGDTPYYESIDMIDAYHPQTIMAHQLNGEDLPVKNGAPLRLRVERQLGYKHAKFVQRIEAVASLKNVYGGKGGYWEDSNDYEWYAGI